MLSGADVALKGEDVAIEIGGGAHPRQVAVAAPYGALLAARAPASGRAFCSAPPRREAKNLVNDFCQGLTADPAAPRLSLSGVAPAFSATCWRRRRRSRTCADSPGSSRSSPSFRYARHVGGATQSKAALRARARAER